VLEIYSYIKRWSIRIISTFAPAFLYSIILRMNYLSAVRFTFSKYIFNNFTSMTFHGFRQEKSNSAICFEFCCAISSWLFQITKDALKDCFFCILLFSKSSSRYVLKIFLPYSNQGIFLIQLCACSFKMWLHKYHILFAFFLKMVRISLCMDMG
jgi:hypothetical protein